MEVILNQDIDRVGKAGSVVKIKDGFARNFLIPNGLAVPVTTANLKKIEQAKQTNLLQAEKLKKEAERLKGKIEGLSLTLPVLIHDEDRLYAGITALDLSQALKEEGLDIKEDAFVLEEPLKSLGIYEVAVKLHPEVSAQIKIWVVKK